MNAALMHDALANEQEPKAGGVLVKAFGSCPAGPLHHAFLTACRHSSKAACAADPKCEWLHDATALPSAPSPMGGPGSSTTRGGAGDPWARVTVQLGGVKMGKEGHPGKLGLRGRGHRMQGGLRGEHCVLALPTVVELVMGWSPFTQAVVKVGEGVGKGEVLWACTTLRVCGAMKGVAKVRMHRSSARVRWASTVRLPRMAQSIGCTQYEESPRPDRPSLSC